MKAEPLKKPQPHQKAFVKPKAETTVWQNQDPEAAEDPAGGDPDVKVTALIHNILQMKYYTCDL